MSRSRSKYLPDERREHLESHGLRLDSTTVSGSIPGLNATHARFDKVDSKPEDEESNRDSHVQYHWRSRDNRKGSFFYWLPVAYPSTEFPKETTIGGGVLFFVGATLFQVGAIFLIFEAVNENQKGCFGWAVRELFCEGDPSSCAHHHQRNDKGKGQLLQRRWQWWPSWHEIRTHYIHEVGFIANVSLAVGATIFYITGILVLPGIYSHLSQGVLWGVYWLSYLVGSILFVFSGVLLLLETQEKWYKPAPHVIGWHAGVWNLIGAVGWILSASFGYCSAHWCEYQSELTLLWASVAYTIGSAILWYEALDKYPVYTKKT
ncbi:hypothetical protein LTR70_007909 [Exophiala xenobiotica]|uniref:Uncharacterized protein n=1 Tax=Lithohypha guttulata TaxID=1690604 RepID=A0ABR0K8Z8_9EURO|nr:hypothetical protein LTR24_005585 [Lithohypha guttulata]KAK5312914.1 hypothetical protein LTR70_007909 [Exophiala xenobiotica]